jgi:hypothetical protein
MPTVNPNLNKRALKEGVVVGPGNTTPLQLGFSTITLPEEWNSDYQPLTIKYPQLASTTPNQLQIVPKADRSTSLCFTNPQLMRNLSCIQSSRLPTTLPSPSRQSMHHHPAPRPKPPPNYCQYCIDPPSTSKFQVFPNVGSSTYHGQHANCSVCKQLLEAVPELKMISRSISSSTLLPKKSLGPSNSTPKFSNGALQADLQFVHLRSPTTVKPPEHLKLQNYINYQSVCLAQNLDNIANDVYDLKEHRKKLHHSVETLHDVHHTFSERLTEIQAQLSTIQLAVSHFQVAIPPPDYV